MAEGGRFDPAAISVRKAVTSGGTGGGAEPPGDPIVQQGEGSGLRAGAQQPGRRRGLQEP